MAGPLRRFGFLLAIVALGLAIGTTVSPVTAQPVPEELDRVCVNRYSGQLRYVRSGQSCTSSEFELRTIADLPYTLCANIYTSTLRYAPADNCNPATERAYPLPDALPLALCVNRYTAAIVVSPYSGQCPPGSFAAAVSQVEPVANDDGTYIVLRGEDLTITTADENDLLDNDVLGVPAGAISSFGLSDAGEVSVPGSTTLAGGELTVDADGSFSLTGADTTGDYSFFYRLSNPAGTSEAEVTIQVQELPDAVDDSNRVEAGGNISAGAGGGLLENDEVGYPEARIVSFGGGALDGTVDDFSAGSRLAPLPGFADGSLLLNDEGAFDFSPPSGFIGEFAFQYRLANAAGSDVATATFHVEMVPTAVNDQYVTPVNVTLSRAASDTDHLLDNDDLGYPLATIASFGGGSLSGDATSNAAGESVALAGGELTVNADGSFELTEPTEPGEYTFDYRIVNIRGESTATVTIQVQQAPEAFDDSFTFELGGPRNGDLTADNGNGADLLGVPPAEVVSLGGGDLGGDVDTYAVGTPLNLAGGQLTVNADGTFTLDNVAEPGDYSFQYRLENAAGDDVATVWIALQQLPQANPDGPYFLMAGQTLTITPDDTNDLLDNDQRGYPEATITTIGGGSLGADSPITDPPSAVEVPGSGGITVTVGADGSLTVDATSTTALTGDYTFTYTLDNGVAQSTADVSIQVQAAPVAVDDEFNVDLDGTLSGNLTDDNGAGADQLGHPAAEVVSFGGGDLSGNVDAHQAGETVTLAGGELTVNADGTFTLENPTDLGDFSFQYRLTNDAGSDVASVTIQVRLSPTAVSDGLYTVMVGGTLSVAATDTDALLANDDLGYPEATLVNFGGGSIGGDVADNASGDSVSLAGGELTVNTDGSFTLAGPTTPGDYTFVYRLANAAGTSDAEVTIQVQESPTATDDGPYTVKVGENLTVASEDPGALHANDLPGFPGPAAIASFGGGSLSGDATSNLAGESVVFAGGDLTVNADGSFSLIGASEAGVYTFSYRLENAAGLTDDAQVTINVEDPPLASDDGPYAVRVGETLTVAALDTNHLLVNDHLGTPAGAIVSFGVDDAAAVTQGNTTTLAGGDLRVNADGSFTLTAPTDSGEYAFLYRLANAAGHDDAQVQIVVQQAPLAVDDGPTADSIPGDAYHTALDTTLDSSASANAENLLANDELGYPLAVLVSFGGGDLGGAPDAHQAGETVALAGGGELTANADGSFIFTPPAGMNGLFSFDYVIKNVAGEATATAIIAVGDRPEAVDDTYDVDVIGNLLIDTSGGTPFSVLDNDRGDALSLTTTTLTSAAGGQVTLNPDGTFTYNPPAGFEGDDSFTYEVDNGFGEPVQGTVNLTVSGMIWFVDAAAAPGGDGRFTSPFNCLAGPIGSSCFDQVAAGDPGDTIFVYSGSYTGGLTLLADQKLVGQGAGATLATLTGLVPPPHSPALPDTGGDAPTLNDDDGDNIRLASGAQVHGLALRGAARGIFGVDITGATLADVDIQTGGSNVGVQILGSSGTFAFDNLTVAQTTTGVDLTDNSTATFDFTGTTSISATTSALLASRAGTININTDGAGSADLTATAGTALNVEDTTLTGTITSVTATNANGRGVVLDNTGYAGAAPDVTFGTLTLTTTNGTAFQALNFGAIAVTDPASTISATSAGAVEIRNTAIGAGGMTFASLSSSGAQSGIVLENTGSGSFAAGGGSIADASLRGVDIEGGSGDFTYAGTIGTTATGRSVEVTSHTGGTVLFSGAIDDDGLGILLASNAGATVRFTGALDIRPASGNNGFTAAGGGTVEVDATGPSANNIVTSDARALHVEDTTIGSAGLEFASISSSGGDYGIYLKNTGTSGGLLVTGQPSVHGSGGTIQGATIDGVYLENAGSVALYQMLISGSDDNNVHAVNVTGLTLDSVSLLNSGNTGFLGASVQDLTFRNGEVHGSGDAAGEQGIDIQNLLGASSITGTTFQDNSVNQLRVVNSTATVSDVLTLSGNTFSSPTPGIYGDQVQVESNTAGNLRLVINTTAGNNAMTGGVIGLHAIATNQGVLEVQISQATIGDTASVGVNLDSTNKGVLRFNVSGVTVTNTGSHGINATSSGDAVLNGTIQNNSVNGTGVAEGTDADGIRVILEGNGSAVVKLENNDVSNAYLSPIFIQARSGTGRIDATVTANTIDNSAADEPTGGIEIVSGRSGGGDATTVCLNMANNNSNGGGDVGYRLTNRATFLLQGFVGDGSSAPDIVNWINNVKSNTGTAAVTVSSPFSLGNCLVPSY